MKIFLAIAAILAWLFGAMLLFMPEKFYSPTGIQMTPMLGTFIIRQQNFRGYQMVGAKFFL